MANHKDDQPTVETPPVFDLGTALGVDGGAPVDATFAGLDFQIRRSFTGAEVLEISQAAIAGKAELLAQIVTTGCDPVALAEAIERNLRDVAGRLWGQILTTAGIAAPTGPSSQGE